MSKKSRPEIRDNLDRRKEQEQDFKGDDITYNIKYEKSEKQKKKTK
jgi:hypothetical protein